MAEALAQVDPQIVSKEFMLLGPTLSRVLTELEQQDVLAQTYRDNCYICGREFNIYAPDEGHHIAPKGAGGSGVADAGWNKAQICNMCHWSIHNGFLKFYRDMTDTMLWVEQFIDDGWQRRVPYGRLKTGEQLSETLYTSQAFGTWLAKQREEMDTWDDEALKTQYLMSENTGTMIFAAQCQIIHILTTRHEVKDGATKTGMGLEDTAQFLGISYQTARLRHAVYQKIFANVPEDHVWHALSAEFFYAAYRNKKTMDPIAALNSAESIRVDNPGYTPTQFKKDIETGFVAKEKRGNSLPVCPFGCSHCKRSSMDTKITLYEGKDILAAGTGEGNWFCDVTKKLAVDLGPEDECEEMTAK